MSIITAPFRYVYNLWDTNVPNPEPVPLREKGITIQESLVEADFTETFSESCRVNFGPQMEMLKQCSGPSFKKLDICRGSFDKATVINMNGLDKINALVLGIGQSAVLCLFAYYTKYIPLNYSLISLVDTIKKTVHTLFVGINAGQNCEFRCIQNFKFTFIVSLLIDGAALYVGKHVEFIGQQGLVHLACGAITRNIELIYTELLMRLNKKSVDQPLTKESNLTLKKWLVMAHQIASHSIVPIAFSALMGFTSPMLVAIDATVGVVEGFFNGRARVLFELNQLDKDKETQETDSVEQAYYLRRRVLLLSAANVGALSAFGIFSPGLVMLVAVRTLAKYVDLDSKINAKVYAKQDKKRKTKVILSTHLTRKMEQRQQKTTLKAFLNEHLTRRMNPEVRNKALRLQEYRMRSN